MTDNLPSPEALKKHLDQFITNVEGIRDRTLSPTDLTDILDGYQNQFAKTDSRSEEKLLLKLGSDVMELGFITYGSSAMIAALRAKFGIEEVHVMEEAVHKNTSIN